MDAKSPTGTNAKRQFQKENADSDSPALATVRRDRFKTYRDRNPLKVIARRRIGTLIRTGKLSRPSECSRCGSFGYTHAHHRDYSKPLEVEWVCVACHRELHGHDRPLYPFHPPTLVPWPPTVPPGFPLTVSKSGYVKRIGRKVHWIAGKIDPRIALEKYEVLRRSSPSHPFSRTEADHATA